MAKNRMPTGLVALSTTAITAIYIAGYVRTQAADATIADAQAAPTASAASVSAPVAAPATPVPTNAPTVPARRGAPQGTSRDAQPPTTSRTAPTATPAPQPAAQSQSAGYTDGTFSGHGTSRRGDVWVDVTVQGGQITNVNITRSTLQYPLRDIAGLPGEVVQRQSAQVDTVSRATYSSMAFKGAVSQALSQAVHG
ncbi:MAG: FMN-binding protein [Chloroflexi bacterium]|nr:FMN-binding protein [Chloroflexota bacterium]